MVLKYNEEGKFRIIQFTDTHLGNMPFDPSDHKTFNLIETALEKLNGDLIVHTGDVIWSDGVKYADVVFEKTMAYFDKVKTPMAVTFGNHDSEEIITRSDLRNLFEKSVEFKVDKKHSKIVDDREAFAVEIFNQDGSGVVNTLFFIDSGAEAPLPIGTYDWVLPQHVEWFRNTSDQYKKNDGVKRNLIFQHIPIPEYWKAAEHILSGEHNETNEAISAPHLNTGLFANMLLNNETWGMFVGHDHDNNFDGLYQGIHLVYGRVSGYQTYGDATRGVRIIDLDMNTNEVKTYTVTINEINEEY